MLAEWRTWINSVWNIFQYITSNKLPGVVHANSETVQIAQGSGHVRNYGLNNSSNISILLLRWFMLREDFFKSFHADAWNMVTFRQFWRDDSYFLKIWVYLSENWYSFHNHISVLTKLLWSEFKLRGIKWPNLNYSLTEITLKLKYKILSNIFIQCRLELRNS